ncbi:MAG TPA: ATP-binding protein [Gemmatimonadales bacterium]|nr:ATP-binding protein [Gemmatimonadales bacterium]
MRVAARLLLGTVGILLFAVIVMVWSSRTALRRHLELQLQADIEEEARLIQAALPEDPAAWGRLVGRWAALRTHRVTLLDPAGRAVADNQVPPSVLATQADMAELPEVKAAREGRTGFNVRSDPAEPARIWVAVPGAPIVRVASDLAVLERAAGRSQRAILFGALLAFGLGTLLALLGGRAISGPLEQMALAARAIPTGQSPRFPRSGLSEIDQLSTALRQMQQELADRFDALRRAGAESSALVDAMVEGVLACDERGRIVTANPAARRLLGYHDTEGMPDLPSLFRVKAAREVVDATLRGDALQDRELELDGRTLLVNSRPLPAGGAVLVMHDVTELRRLETVRRDFVANVSHELKTPLTSISGYAETLLSENPDEGTRRIFLRTILTNAQRIQSLVDDQLDLARIESGRWQPRVERLEVGASARDAWTPRADRAAAGKIAFKLDVPPDASTVQADAEAMRQILGNLYDNALRFTPPGGSITLGSKVVDGGVAVSVRDTGTGIGSEHLPRIFERYYRVDAGRARDAGGTGLGLAIVKHLVEAHGGRVAAESELGVGTVVTCWFPTMP